MKARHGFILLALFLLILPASASAPYWLYTFQQAHGMGDHFEPSCAYRYAPAEETFSEIHDGLGTGEIAHPNYTLQLIAGTTNNKFVNMSRCLILVPLFEIPKTALIEDTYVDFIAEVNTTLGPFSIEFTSGTPDNLGSIDKDEYEKYNNSLISDTVYTFDGNGTYNVTFKLNEYGKTQVLQRFASDADNIPMYIRFKWDVDNNFNGAWASGGLANMYIEGTEPEYPHNRTRFLFNYDIRPLSPHLREVATINETLGYIFGPHLFYGESGMVRDSTGTMYVAYIDTAEDPTTAIITIARSTDNGNTWAKDEVHHIEETSLWGNINLMIDQFDRISIVYGTPFRGAGYRNYSVSGGFGDEILFTPVFSAVTWPAAIDSHGTIHVVWSDLSDGLVRYRNMSTSTLIAGDVIVVSGSTTADQLLSPHIMVDSEDNVHMVWLGNPVGVNGYGLMYRNFTYGGNMGDLIQMSDVDVPQYPAHAIFDRDNVLHILYKKYVSPFELYYVNTSAASNFVLSTPLYISATSNYYKYPTFAIDKEGTIHFIWSDDSPAWPHTLRYRNMTAGGLGPVATIDNSLGGVVAFSSLFGYTPVDNTPDSSIIFTAISNAEPYRVLYGEYPLPEPPTYVNPFNVVTIESTAQTIQMIITLGILLSILAIVGMLVMRYVGTGD